jgi:hypothetical protein
VELFDRLVNTDVGGSLVEHDDAARRLLGVDGEQQRRFRAPAADCADQLGGGKGALLAKQTISETFTRQGSGETSSSR